MKKILCLLFSLAVANRPSSTPYVTGDSFRSLAKHVLDAEYIERYKRDPAKFEQILYFDPSNVKENDIVFVDSRAYDVFFTKIFPYIKHKFVLITHNSDFSAPANYIKELHDERIIHWFGDNPSIQGHPKFTALPIGILNKNHHWTPIDCPGLIDRLVKSRSNNKRDILCYSNFTVHKMRKSAFKSLKNKSFITRSKRKPLVDYYKDLLNSKFVISPTGGGLDCFRTWEALYCGAYPIVISSHLDELLEGLPVLIINDWSQITEEFLKEKARLFDRTNWDRSKLNFEYWRELIFSKTLDTP